MKKLLSLSLLLALCLALAAPAMGAGAVLSPQKLRVDGREIDCEKYNINGTNYFKLRDLASLLSGTGSQFSVGWDEASKTAKVVSGEPYEPIGGELVVGEDKSASAQPSSQIILINGEQRTDLKVYNIGGNNFFQLKQMAALLGFAADYESSTNTAVVTSRPAPEPEPEPDPLDNITGGIHHAEITVRDYGVIKLELDADTAPITVANFVKLARQGFYDGLTFHRIMDGFMIQGGDPLGNGRGGSGEKIKGEFSANGVENKISHKAGVISMARAANDYDSASSQFFIMVASNTGLDGQYAAFGHVTSGLDVVRKIARDARPTDNNGTIPAEAQPVIESIVILD